MLNLLEIEKSRLSPKEIDAVCNAHSKSVRLNRVVSSEALLIKGRLFSGFEIMSSNFKGSLTFMNCHFKGNFAISQTKAAGQISFINCEFSKDVTLFGAEVSGSISFIDSGIIGRLMMNGCSTPKVDLQSVASKAIFMKAQEIKSRVQNLTFKSVMVAGAIRIDNIAGIQRIDADDVTSDGLQFKQLGLIGDASIRVVESNINKMVLDDLKLHNVKMLFHALLGENLYIHNSSFKDTSLLFEQVILNGMFTVKHCNYLNSEIDISSITSSSLEVDDALFDFLTKRGQHGSAVFSEALPSKKRIQTLKRFKDLFAQEHRYDLEDATFYLLKNIESNHSIQQAKWWQKPLKYTLYFLNRFIMGWGVRVLNPLMSSLAFMGLYATGYYILLELYKADRYIEYLGQRLSGVSAASAYSVLAFFGQQADAKINGYIPIGLALGEFILGIAMTTIIVGILIRKLVR